MSVFDEERKVEELMEIWKTDVSCRHSIKWIFESTPTDNNEERERYFLELDKKMESLRKKL